MLNASPITVDQVINVLESMKAHDIQSLDVHLLSSLYSHMIICSATSIRHIHSISNQLIDTTKPRLKVKPTMHGPENSGWLLVDLGDIIVHVMLDEMRQHYQLEKLWSHSPNTNE